MDQLISFILSPNFSGWFGILRVVFVILSLALLWLIIAALVKTSWLKRMALWDLQEILTYRPFGVRKIVKQWRVIKEKLETGQESECKLAVIKADEMLFKTLNKMGFGGKALGECLAKLTTASLPDIEDVKLAHRIRNNIIHDPDYRLTLEEAKKAIEVYEKALTDLQAL